MKNFFFIFSLTNYSLSISVLCVRTFLCIFKALLCIYKIKKEEKRRREKEREREHCNEKKSKKIKNQIMRFRFNTYSI
jgi:hypothetical protein